MSRRTFRISSEFQIASNGYVRSDTGTPSFVMLVRYRQHTWPVPAAWSRR
jgi:hypothetical protein